jgi:hypothetical protein
MRVGSLRIIRKFGQQGVAGTTRPQIELISDAGHCAVHGQGEKASRVRWAAASYRPEDERLYLNLINSERKPLKVVVEYPYNDGSEEGLEPVAHVVVIPPYGARNHEVELPESYRDKLPGRMLTIRWRTDGPHQAYLICATPNLDRLSIDHV